MESLSADMNDVWKRLSDAWPRSRVSCKTIHAGIAGAVRAVFDGIIERLPSVFSESKE